MMDDLINRQAAIKEIARWKGYLDDDMISRIQVGLNRLPSAHQWIPCSERMPDEDYCSSRGVQYSEPVLVTVVNLENDEDIFVYTACTKDGEWQLNYPKDDNSLEPEWCEVVAWMPLPEPYESEEQ